MSPPTTTLALAAVVCLASGFAWAGPAVNGSYQGDAFGPVELRTSGDQLVGTAPAGGPCQRPVAQQVLNGSFLGNVFIGDVTLCQKGDACSESATYAVMLFYNFEERALGGLVKMEGGCESDLLKNGMLVLRALEQGASAQPAAAPAPERQVQAPTPASPSGSAAQVAAQRRLEAVDVPAALRQGQQALAAMNPLTASQQFQLVLAQEKNNATALTGMAVAHFLRDQKLEALKFLEQARGVGNQQARAEAWFWMACVKRATQESKVAQEALRRAVVVEGWSAPEGNALVDRELLRLSNEGPNFDALVKQARGRKRAQGRDSQGAGSVSP
ncbi:MULTISPECIES: hypothetical protein [Corallococcus]|uniref:hypothetical protein n=1 Tax=Corallococcus TaxID=83461 RepID=UPI0011C39B99|nr:MULTISPECIES: hypothetical protein [Corallococcus]